MTRKPAGEQDRHSEPGGASRPRKRHVLSGTFIYGMDRKGRVVMPAQFRTQLGAPFVLTRAPGQCLLAMSALQWDALVERYEQSVLFRGYYLSAAVDCPVDDNTGRFLIPHVLREYAELRAMDEVAISGIGRAVQVARRSRWEEHLQSGEFPSLGQLDLDLEVPRPVETMPYTQKLGRPMGLPLLECRGRMHGRAVRRLASTLDKLFSQDPPVVILDVRETGDTEPALALVQALTRQQREERLIPLWVVSEEPLPPDSGVFHFNDLEEVLWKLEELRPRGRRNGRSETVDLEDAEEVEV
jgi:MraZ protein